MFHLGEDCWHSIYFISHILVIEQLLLFAYLVVRVCRQGEKSAAARGATRECDVAKAQGVGVHQVGIVALPLENKTTRVYLVGLGQEQFAAMFCNAGATCSGFLPQIRAEKDGVCSHAGRRR